jgi:hypothetical protein
MKTDPPTKYRLIKKTYEDGHSDFHLEFSLADKEPHNYSLLNIFRTREEALQMVSARREVTTETEYL